MPKLTMGQGVTYSVQGTRVVLEFDTAKVLYSTDKGNGIVATSQGNKDIVVNGQSVKVGLNAYIPKG